VKRSDRDEAIWFVTHICMETTQAKTLYFSFYFTCFFFNKIREQERGAGSARRQGWGRDQIMYTLVSKCKNGKIKLKKWT
jgi:hypothetical protein